MPALGTPNADSGALAHLVGLRPLDEEVDALSGPADVSTGRVENTKRLCCSCGLMALMI